MAALLDQSGNKMETRSAEPSRPAKENSAQLVELAERQGFEPWNTREDVTGIPVQRLRPLGHLSVFEQTLASHFVELALWTGIYGIPAQRVTGPSMDLALRANRSARSSVAQIRFLRI